MQQIKKASLRKKTQKKNNNKDNGDDSKSNNNRAVTFLFIGKIIFNYIDIFSDYVVVSEFFQYFLENLESDIVLFYFICAFNATFAVIIDRVFTYFFILDVIKEKKLDITNQGDNSSIEKVNISKFDRLKGFLLTVLYLDYIYIFISSKSLFSDSTLLKTKKKNLIELICENYLLLIASTLLLFIKYVNNENVGIMNIIATTTSFISTIVTVYQNFFIRYEEQPLVKDKDLIQFEDMDVDTQRFVSNPAILDCYKLISKEKFQYSQVTYPDIKLNKQIQKPISWIKAIILAIMVVLEVTTMMVLFSIQGMIENSLFQIFRFHEGFIVGFPFFYKYLKTFKQENQEKYVKQQKLKGKPYKITTFKKELWKLLIMYPYIYILTVIQIRFHIGNQVYPFMHELKENWVQNFIPSKYLTIWRLIFQGRDIISIFLILNYEIETDALVGYTPNHQNRENNLFNKQSYVWYSLYFAAIGYLIQFLFYFTDFIFYRFFAKKNSNDKTEKAIGNKEKNVKIQDSKQTQQPPIIPNDSKSSGLISLDSSKQLIAMNDSKGSCFNQKAKFNEVFRSQEFQTMNNKNQQQLNSVKNGLEYSECSDSFYSQNDLQEHQFNKVKTNKKQFQFIDNLNNK